MKHGDCITRSEGFVVRPMKKGPRKKKRRARKKRRVDIGVWVNDGRASTTRREVRTIFL